MENEYQMPNSALELCEIIGRDNVITLMKHFGGTYLDVPKTPEKASILNKILPPDVVAKLCWYQGGLRISYIPTLRPSLANRNAEIRALYKQIPKREIALRYGLSYERISQICRCADNPH